MEPWNKNPFAPDEFTAVTVKWDYINEVIVGNGRSNLFDTCSTYFYDRGSLLPWHVSRFPSEMLYVQEHQVPEMVRLAVMVSV